MHLWSFSHMSSLHLALILLSAVCCRDLCPFYR